MRLEEAPATRTVIAYNDAADSGNPMHDDEAARAMNFKGALVPGVTAFGFVTHAFVTYFGDAWLSEGSMEVRFRKPVYAGESMSVEATFADDTLNVEVNNPEQEVCVIGRGSMLPNSEIVKSIPSSPIPPPKKLPGSKLSAERAQLEEERIFGSIEALFTNAEADQFLGLLQDGHEIYRGGVTHPAWLLRQANIIVDKNYAIGPWIHVASAIQNYALAYNDEPVEVRAEVIDLFERKGNEYFDLDVAILADGDPERLIMRVMHRAIFKMGKAG
jgi:acyl dehydratase